MSRYPSSYTNKNYETQITAVCIPSCAGIQGALFADKSVGEQANTVYVCNVPANVGDEYILFVRNASAYTATYFGRQVTVVSGDIRASRAGSGSLTLLDFTLGILYD